MQLTQTFDEVNPNEFEGTVVVEGRAPEYLRLKPGGQEMVGHFMSSNKLLAAICHGIRY